MCLSRVHSNVFYLSKSNCTEKAVLLYIGFLRYCIIGVFRALYIFLLMYSYVQFVDDDWVLLFGSSEVAPKFELFEIF